MFVTFVTQSNSQNFCNCWLLPLHMIVLDFEAVLFQVGLLDGLLRQRYFPWQNGKTNVPLAPAIANFCYLA